MQARVQACVDRGPAACCLLAANEGSMHRQEQQASTPCTPTNRLD